MKKIIKIKDYFTDETNEMLDTIYQDLLIDKNNIEKYKDIVSEENHNLLSISLRNNKNELAFLLIDIQFGLDHINDRKEHSLIDCFDEYFFDGGYCLLKILEKINNFKFEKKSFFWEQLLTHKMPTFFESKEIFCKSLELLDLHNINKKHLMKFEMFAQIYDKEKPLYDIWQSFKKEKQIHFSLKEQFLYFLETVKNEDLLTYSLTPNVNKPYYKLINAFVKSIIYKIDNIDNQEMYNNNPYLEKIDKLVGERTLLNYQQLVNYKIFDTIHNLKIKELSKGKLFSSTKFFDYIIYTKHSAYGVEQKDFIPLLKKYGLKSISFPKNYSQHLVYEYLDAQLDILSSGFNIDKMKLGCNILNLTLDNPFKENTGGFYNVNHNYIKIFNTSSLDHLLSTSFYHSLNLLKKYYKSSFNTAIAHEYTHFLQYIKKEDKDFIFNTEDIKKEWKEIEKTLKNTQSKEFCIDYLINYCFKTNNEQIDPSLKNILEECFKPFNSDFKKDLNYIKSFLNLTNFLNNSNLEHTSIFCKVIINAYHSQRESSYQEQIWKELDILKGKKYYLKDIEIHARLVEQFIFNDKEDNLSYLNSNAHENIEEVLKPKLVKFNQMLISNLENFYHLNNTKLQIIQNKKKNSP